MICPHFFCAKKGVEELDPRKPRPDQDFRRSLKEFSKEDTTPSGNSTLTIWRNHSIDIILTFHNNGKGKQEVTVPATRSIKKVQKQDNMSLLLC